jgi:uncharacterized protein YkwD
MRHAVVLFAVLLVALPSCEPTPLETRTFDAINGERKKAGLPPLEFSERLRQIARCHTGDMVERGVLDHQDKDGRMIENRLGKRLDWIEVGENIARNKGYEDAVAEAVRGWMESPAHRKNILSEKFEETGIGAEVSEQDGYTYFTQVFLLPMPK